MEKKLTVIPPSQTNVNEKPERAPRYKVAAYCRVSTEQEEQLGSFANQVAYYTDYINGKEDYQLAGIFADEGISGTGTRKRAGFRGMIAACEVGKVDLVITKSISRFARNTRDCLHYARHLKSLGIPVIFEKEGINTMEASGELLFTILSSLAQEESRNISENTRWGIRSRFQQGIPHINTANFLGYDKDEQGNLVINENQAQVVRRIYREFLEGWQPSEITRKLNAEKIPGVHGEPRWAAVSVLRILQNEKYKGDLLMQKYYIRDFLTKELERNEGKLTQYYVENNHEPIIEREIWEAVQLEIKRIRAFKEIHHIRELGSGSFEPFYGKVFCSCCGGRFVKQSGRSTWRCINSSRKKEGSCEAKPMEEQKIEEYVTSAWASVISQRELLLPVWEKALSYGNALERLRATQMKELTGRYTSWQEVENLARMLILEIQLAPSGKVQILFMDGTCLENSGEWMSACTNTL